MVHDDEDIGPPLEGLDLCHVGSPHGFHPVGDDPAVVGPVRPLGRAVQPPQALLPQDPPQPALAHRDAFVPQALPDLEAALAAEGGVHDRPVGVRGDPLVAVPRLRPPLARRGTRVGLLAATAVVGALSDFPDTADGFDAVGLFRGGRCGPAHFVDLGR